MNEPEHLVIRPPSEAMSLLVRVVRGCDWNRCLFCGIYDLYDTPHSIRSPEEVKADIDALNEQYGDSFRSAFLGDANPMKMPTDFLVDVISHLKKRFPSLKRTTSYARASSVWKKTQEELKAIHDAGLDRIHIGMESGSNEVLALHKKGTNQKQLIESGLKCRDAGLEISYYLLLGLGGQSLWQDHVNESVKVLNEVKPDYIRVRRLWIHQASRLNEKIVTGEFKEQTPEGTVIELRDIIKGIDAQGSHFTCDHANNYIQVHGDLNKQKKEMLDYIERFLALPENIRSQHYDSMPSVI